MPRLTAIVAIIAFACTAICSTETRAQEVVTTTSEFTGSGGVAVGPDGNIYVADFGNTLGGGSQQSVPGTQVFRVTPAGEITEFATGLSGASGNAFGPDGFLYQSNIAAGRISKIAPDGTVTTLSNSNLITGPVGVAVDPAGNVFNTNCSNNTITKTTPQGVTTVFATGGFLNCPNGLTIDPEGNLYTSNFSDCRVIQITPEGGLKPIACLNRFDPGGPGNGHLTYANERLYVCAWQGNRIYEVALDGSSSVAIVGDGNPARDDGSWETASFNQPNGIAASRTGDTLYVNDTVTITSARRNLHPNVLRMITGVNAEVTANQNEVPTDGSAELEPIYPNPVSGQVNATFVLDEQSDVVLDVADVLGRSVGVLSSGIKAPGRHKVLLDASRLSPGTYIYRLTTETTQVHRTFVVAR